MTNLLLEKSFSLDPQVNKKFSLSDTHRNYSLCYEFSESNKAKTEILDFNIKLI
jgi:hypothetical protein